MGNLELNIKHMLKISDDKVNFIENATIIYTFPYSDLLATHRQFEINNREHEQLLKNNRSWALGLVSVQVSFFLAKADDLNQGIHTEVVF